MRKLAPRRVDRPFIKEIAPYARADEPRLRQVDRRQPKTSEPPKAAPPADRPVARERPIKAAPPPDRPASHERPATAAPPPDRSAARERPVKAAPPPDRPASHDRPATAASPPNRPAVHERPVKAAPPPNRSAAQERPVKAVPQPDRAASHERPATVRAVDPSPLRTDARERDVPAGASDPPAPPIERAAALDHQAATVHALDASPPQEELVQARDREPPVKITGDPLRPERPAPRDREPVRAEAPAPRWDDQIDPQRRDIPFRPDEIRPGRDRIRAWDVEPTIRLEESWTARYGSPGARDRGTDSVPIWAWLLLLIFLGAAAYVGYQQWQQRQEQPSASLPATAAVPGPAPPAIATPEPAIRHPVAETEPEKPLPGLDQSDAAMRALVTGLVGAKNFQAMVYPQQLVRRIVATVDNLPRKTAPVQIRPIKPAPGQYTPNPANMRRYAAYVRAVESIDTRALVQGYVMFYPLFQRAYADLGFPDRYFNDRLVEAIDDLLAAPDLTRPTELIQPKVFYLYADPRLEARSAGQKFMMRLGPENAARIKAKLREIRGEITKSSAPDRR